MVVTTFSNNLSFSADVDFYPVWGAIPVAPAPSSPTNNQSNNGSTTPRSSSSVSPVATQSPTASSTSTSIGFKRVNGLTQVNFGLPAKYVGKAATIEVKRWINNRVRYFVIDISKVQAPGAAGRAALTFDFKLKLKPTDVIRIKVGKVEVFKQRLQERR